MSHEQHDRHIDRREFIRISGLVGGGLLVASALDTDEAMASSTAALAPVADFAPNVFVSIAPSGGVTLVAPNSEMGQGIKTSLPMIIAEELDVAWEQVTVVQGDLNPAYGRQFSVGSGSTVANYMAMRRAGAAARAALVEAAAQEWKVPASECTTTAGMVMHAASNKKASYGSLATKAAQLQPPVNLTLKDPSTFTLLGTRIPGVDNRKIVKGEPLFGIDVKLPGMLYATYTKCCSNTRVSLLYTSLLPHGKRPRSRRYEAGGGPRRRAPKCAIHLGDSEQSHIGADSPLTLRFSTRLAIST